MLCVMNQMLEPTMTESPIIESPTVYDVVPDWSTIKADKFELKKINDDLEGHFIDFKTPWCFFTIANSYGEDVDIELFYNELLGWEDNTEIQHEGQLSPDWLYEYSLIFITSNNYNFSVDDISNKNFDYLMLVSQNNYPIVVWIEGKNWMEGTPYILYKTEGDFVYLINAQSETILKRDLFEKEWDKCGHRALVYGKYW